MAQASGYQEDALGMGRLLRNDSEGESNLNIFNWIPQLVSFVFSIASFAGFGDVARELYQEAHKKKIHGLISLRSIYRELMGPNHVHHRQN